MFNTLMFEKAVVRLQSTYNLSVYVKVFPTAFILFFSSFIMFFKVLCSPYSYNVFSEARWNSSAL